MSGRILNWAARARAGNPTAKAVLMVLAEACDDKGETFIGQGTLAERCDARRETVNKVMKRLEIAGLITRTKRRRADGYQSSDLTKLTLCDFKSRDGNTHENGSDVSLEATSCDEFVDSDVTQTGQPNPQYNPQIKTLPLKQVLKVKTQSPKADDAGGFEKAWATYPHVKGRSSKPKSKAAWNKLSANDMTDLVQACENYRQSSKAKEDGGKWVKAFHCWIKDELWCDYRSAPADLQNEVVQVETSPWPSRLSFWQTGRWNSLDWGPKPGEKGCRLPPDLVVQLNHPSANISTAA